MLKLSDVPSNLTAVRIVVVAGRATAEEATAVATDYSVEAWARLVALHRQDGRAFVKAMFGTGPVRDLNGANINKITESLT